MYAESIHRLTADRLAQLVERRTTVREVVGSNPDWTKNQGLKITGKIMLEKDPMALVAKE